MGNGKVILNVLAEMTQEEYSEYKKDAAKQITSIVARRIEQGSKAYITNHYRVIGEQIVEKSTGKIISQRGSQILGQIASSGLGASARINPATGALTAVSSLAGNYQSYKIQKSVNAVKEIVQQMQTQISAVQKLSGINVGLGTANLGASVVSTVIICKKLDEISEIVTSSKKSIEQIQKQLEEHQYWKSRDLLREYKTYVLKLKSRLSEYGQTPFDRQKQKEIGDLLVEIASFLNEVIELFDKRMIGGTLGCEIILPLGMAYYRLLRLYSVDYCFQWDCLPPTLKELFSVFEKISQEEYKRTLFRKFLLENPVAATKDLKERAGAISRYARQCLEDTDDHIRLAVLLGKTEYENYIKKEPEQIAATLQNLLPEEDKFCLEAERFST